MTRDFCTPDCRANGGWIVDGDGNMVARCRCRLDPKLVAMAERDTALAQVGSGSAMDAALLIIEDTAKVSDELSANEVRSLMVLAQIPGPVIGAAFHRAAQLGYIQPIGRHPSTQRETHGHAVSKYRSLIKVA